MAKVIAPLGMSVDGFIAAANDGADVVAALHDPDGNLPEALHAGHVRGDIRLVEQQPAPVDAVAREQRDGLFLPQPDLVGRGPIRATCCPGSFAWGGCRS
jgi:hypothetical protein